MIARRTREEWDATAKTPEEGRIRKVDCGQQRLPAIAKTDSGVLQS